MEAVGPRRHPTRLRPIDLRICAPAKARAKRIITYGDEQIITNDFLKINKGKYGTYIIKNQVVRQVEKLKFAKDSNFPTLNVIQHTRPKKCRYAWCPKLKRITRQRAVMNPLDFLPESCSEKIRFVNAKAQERAFILHVDIHRLKWSWPEDADNFCRPGFKAEEQSNALPVRGKPLAFFLWAQIAREWKYPFKRFKA